MRPDDLDAIIVATTTPDMFLPCTAAIIQQKIGASNAYGFDVNVACSGFLFALTTGASLIAGAGIKMVAVVGTDVMTSIIDKSDRNTAVLFGDGAGAVILEQVEDGYGIIDFEHKMDGSGGPLLCMPGGGSLNPSTVETIAKRMHFVQQDGKEVYKRAVHEMSEVSRLILERNNINTDDLSLFIPHQANLRIIDAVAKRLALPADRIAINIKDFANTTAATIPTALHSSIELDKIKHNDLVVFASFGAGFAWGSVLIRWA
jgi:3-oxoacyl-[acyl-carrier-protein] synthase-3